jgi:hypothetical protein
MKKLRILAYDVPLEGRRLTDDEAKYARDFGVSCSKRFWLVPADRDWAVMWKPKYGHGHTSGTDGRMLVHGVLVGMRKI